LEIHNDRRIGQTLVSPPAKPGAYLCELLMPRLGEPIEPARAARVRPWWREVDAADAPPAGEKQEELARTLPYPMD